MVVEVVAGGHPNVARPSTRLPSHVTTPSRVGGATERVSTTSTDLIVPPSDEHRPMGNPLTRRRRELSQHRRGPYSRNARIAISTCSRARLG